MTHQFDSIIFDMDGTLWDATDSYVKCWQIALKKLGLPDVINRPILESVMGFEEKQLLAKLFSHYNSSEQKEIISAIKLTQDEHLEILGGQLYRGVTAGLEKLSKHYRIFMLSNCFPNTIYQFLNVTKLSSFIEGHICYGENQVPKSENIKYLTTKFNLKNTVYVGDTNGDRSQAELASVPFIYMTYGFDKVDTFYKSFDEFEALTEYFVGLKK